MPIGPQLSPSLAKRKRSDDVSDDNDSGKGTDAPAPSNRESNVESDDNTAKKARVVGPTLPPTLANKDSAGSNSSDGDTSSDDDEFGPSLPSTTPSVPQTTLTAPANKTVAPATTQTPQSQRDEWMTLAPSSGDWSQRIDPTKLKNRKFNTSKSNATKSSGSDSWHETPEQKQARLQREVLGVKEQQSVQIPSKNTRPQKADTGASEVVKDRSTHRGPSLYDAHQKGKPAEQDDDPSARAFDREKDIAGASQLNGTQRREMLKKSSDFSSRFSSAKYL